MFVFRYYMILIVHSAQLWASLTKSSRNALNAPIDETLPNGLSPGTLGTADGYYI